MKLPWHHFNPVPIARILLLLVHFKFQVASSNLSLNWFVSEMYVKFAGQWLEHSWMIWHQATWSCVLFWALKGEVWKLCTLRFGFWSYRFGFGWLLGLGSLTLSLHLGRHNPRSICCNSQGKMVFYNYNAYLAYLGVTEVAREDMVDGGGSAWHRNRKMKVSQLIIPKPSIYVLRLKRPLSWGVKLLSFSYVPSLNL